MTGYLLFSQEKYENWWGVARIELLASKGSRLQRGDGTTHPYVHSPKIIGETL
jgi:hypothetical protein